MPFEVVALRRYPVKSMGGEALDHVELDSRGLAGDRWFAVQDEDGCLASGKHTRRFRRHDAVFGYQALTARGGAVEVRAHGGCWPAGDASLDAELSGAFGCPVRVTQEDGAPHQDAGSVSLVGTASLRWCQRQLGVDADPRRLRANIVVGTDEPFVEESWVGDTIRLGGCVLRVVERVERCRMIDIAQDGVTPARRWLTPLAEHRDMSVAVYADVVTPGRVRVGDTVEERSPTTGRPRRG